ncbi:DUF4265 domain-containing protein [Gilvimarinus sp. F26214L]|uniref:DUF4265 domain-containing protein n=1 Tax=Gilvimarinus sp. DZF01 TaxID=3461371 RepID=UPI0040460B35
MQSLQELELLAGYDPEGKPVAERLQVKVNEDGNYQLVRSPAFVRGLASGDIIKLDSDSQQFEIVQHSGNLAICIYSRENATRLSEALTPQLEKLGGHLDLETERMLVYSIHVSIGFKNIEELLNQHVTAESQSVWQYGNVYDPEDGQTPLNWWLDILKPQ